MATATPLVDSNRRNELPFVLRSRTFLTFAFCLLPALSVVGAFASTAGGAQVKMSQAQSHAALAGRIGSRPIGSAANAKAREYRGRIDRLGFTVASGRPTPSMPLAD